MVMGRQSRVWSDPNLNSREQHDKMIVKPFVGPFLIDVAHKIWVNKTHTQKIIHLFVSSAIKKITIVT